MSFLFIKFCIVLLLIEFSCVCIQNTKPYLLDLVVIVYSGVHGGVHVDLWEDVNQFVIKEPLDECQTPAMRLNKLTW